jgi:nucleoside-diphosphate-sugar epimerase
MRVFMTGSSGQIGTNLGMALLEQGHSLECIDIRKNTWTDALDQRLVDLVALAHANRPITPRQRPDVLVHLAAHAKVFELVQNPQKALDNVLMLFPVLEYARQEAVPLVFASSREVYGDIHQWITPEPTADFVVSRSPYSAGKIAAEAFLYSYHQCYQLPCLVFRFSNVYGRYDCDLARLERVIPLFIREIAAEKPIEVYGREKILDFTYVDDCVSGVMEGIRQLAAGKLRNETINLAYGRGYALEDVVNIIAAALGKAPRVTWLPSRPGEVTRYVADIAKAQRLLGYAPQTCLSAGLLQAIEWQKRAGYIK